jgi:hypothetical protein
MALEKGTFGDVKEMSILAIIYFNVGPFGSQPFFRHLYDHWTHGVQYY